MALARNPTMTAAEKPDTDAERGRKARRVRDRNERDVMDRHVRFLECAFDHRILDEFVMFGDVVRDHAAVRRLVHLALVGEDGAIRLDDRSAIRVRGRFDAEAVVVPHIDEHKKGYLKELWLSQLAEGRSQLLGIVAYFLAHFLTCIESD